MGKTNFGPQSHLKRFWNDYQRHVQFWISNLGILTSSNLGKYHLLNLDDLLCGLFRDVVGRADGENALVATDEKSPFEEPGALVVKEVFIPAILYQFGNDHDNLAVGMFRGEVENKLNDGNNDETVGRRQRGELGRVDAGGAKGLIHVTVPIHMQKFGMIAGLDVDGDDFRREPRGKFERFLGDLAPVLNGKDDDGRRAVVRGDHSRAAARRHAAHVALAAHQAEDDTAQK